MKPYAHLTDSELQKALKQANKTVNDLVNEQDSRYRKSVKQAAKDYVGKWLLLDKKLGYSDETYVHLDSFEEISASGCLHYNTTQLLMYNTGSTFHLYVDKGIMAFDERKLSSGDLVVPDSTVADFIKSVETEVYKAIGKVRDL